ncbi:MULTISPECIES: molybdate ABC transporter substrate-binding protein [Fusobacterium]|uniref:molybdate ABC transporter substrate-binding protein n=1 Tax=Fusobacterium TaxID=848 RepID=UPI0008A2E03F|nr:MULTISPECIES: molybdate ABC transporter substrate-binding protein [Fusobacterium]MCF0171689.1 molybdate ABC transporter substrate-binding protein [Fusobacterium varium]OFL93329.1 molybdate ABC transporter substrate-binding protein [Fusobacterium sp. HMSC073F01]
MKRFFTALVTAVSIFLLVACGKTEKKEITISAAASLNEVLSQIVENYQKENKDVVININFGASGALKKQIEGGAPVDFVFFASKKDLEDLRKQNLVSEKFSRDILENTMVVAGRKKIDSLSELLDHKVAIGDPDVVPAGRYAKQVLQNEGLWDRMQENFVLSKDVRSAMQYVDLYEVDYAMIYKTDSKVMKNAEIVYEVPNTLHTPIIYSCGILKDKERDEVKSFYKFLTTKGSIDTFEKFGFKVINE